MTTEEPCYICYEMIKEDELMTLICNHKYHYDCIIETFRNNKQNSYKTRQCPYCRMNTNYLPLRMGYLPIRDIHLEYNNIRKSKIKIEDLESFSIIVNPDKCSMFLKSGPNKGKQCSKNRNDQSIFCTCHKKSKNKDIYIN